MTRIRQTTSEGLGARLMLLLAALLLLALPVCAQTQSTSPAQPAPKLTRPADEEALQKAAVIKDPQERLEALIKVVQDFPRAVYIRNVAFYLLRSLKPMYSEPEKARPFIKRFVEGTQSASAYARTEFYYAIARELVNNKLLTELAVELAQQSIPLLNEQDYLDNERRANEQKEAYFKARDPQHEAEPFSVAEATEKYRSFRALNHATLGRAYFQAGKLEEAAKTLKQAFEMKPTMEA